MAISDQLREIQNDLRNLRDEVQKFSVSQARINQKYEDYISTFHHMMAEHVTHHKVIGRRIWEITCGVILSLVTAIIGLIMRLLGGSGHG